MKNAKPLKRQNEILFPDCTVATAFMVRFLGLMGRKGLPANQALVFPRCNSIHTFFMRFAIDVVLVDKRGTVLHIEPAMKPWRMLLPRKGVAHTVEMKAGRAQELKIELGNQLSCEGAWD